MRVNELSRRRFLKTLGVSTASLFLSSVFPACERKLEKPNIIFIMADDLGYGDLGCYGQKYIQTPNIDRLAAEGTRFTQCYTGSTVCAPSRSVLMTGQHTGHTTVRGNKSDVARSEENPEGRVPLRKEDITVAQILKKAGYVTGITGKWGLGEPGTSGIPNKKGFDEWFGFLNQKRAHNYYPTYIWRNTEKVELKGNQGGKKEQYVHDLFTEFALDFIRKNHNNPFFLYLPYTIPHADYVVPSIEPYTDRAWKEEEKIFAAMVTRMDKDVGRIMQLLKELKIDEKTIVFFCSDNGAARRWEGVFDSSGPLRGYKRDLYEGGIRTPMIIRWPGKVEAGVVNDWLVWYFADVLPTLADLADVEPPDNIDGISVLPAILGKKQNLPDRYLYWEFYEREFQQAVRWRNWKAVRLSKDAPIELYNIVEDIAEKNNVAEQNPEIVQKMAEFMKEAHIDSKYWPVT